MTQYNCCNCNRYEHISQLSEFIITKKIGKLKVKHTIRLCKWCLTKAGIKYKTVDNWIEIEAMGK